MIHDRHTVLITLLVLLFMGMGRYVYVNFSALNPFKKGLADYEYTDLVFSKFQPQAHFDERIILVNTGRPDRGKIAQAIQKIGRFGPRVIGADIIFEGKKEATSDSILQTVLQNNNVVLADFFDPDETRTPPHACDPAFCHKDNFGFTNFIARSNRNIRHFAPFIDYESKPYKHLSLAIASAYEAGVLADVHQRNRKVEEIYYRGNQDSYAHVELDQILTEEFAGDWLKDKIVLLGYMGQDEWSASVKDKYFTPVNGKIGLKSEPDMFGVVIHANIISMMLDRAYIHPSNKVVDLVFGVALLYLIISIFRWVYENINAGYWKLVRIFQLTMIFLLFAVGIAFFYFFHWKVNFSLLIVGIALGWDFVLLYGNLIQKKQKLFQKK